MNVIVNIFVAIGAGIVASAIVVGFYEAWTAPKLKVDLDDGPRATGSRPGDQPGENRRYEFYHVKVWNARSWVPLFARKAAWASSATIEVFDANGNRLVKDPVHGRWSSAPEPVIPAIAPAHENAVLSSAGTTAVEIKGVQINLLDVGRLYSSGRKADIHPNEDQRLAIAIKYEGEPDCYLFSNESYQDTWWRLPAWRIPLGTHRLRITVSYPCGREVAQFRLANAGPGCDDVRLERWRPA
ncbi:hypothetical protein AMK68_00720 [candidate division KD3-62 bacterium DG_56]|uniref:Uncharacterized protein n=1 Tax=candidate division KD3-62 bacterium DG_56 TaxID=1704032 RepID=A0A0S7XQY1_9BACT|nr:MAG: hypothetical protein AMK68_00720 [candidate division KD3-62 bacterium DG_56]